MKRNILNFVGISSIIASVYGGCFAGNVYADTARVSLNSMARSRAGDEVASSRRSTPAMVSRTAISRSAPGRVSARGAITSNAMRGASSAARSATVSRTALASDKNISANSSRSAVSSDVSRVNTARATAVFNDVSKIGGGYAACREAYATCMDQFCANANDTYRRCFCSSRFSEFRDTEDALDQAKTLLMQFEDNNLNAVDKSADEVNAMYSATVGEMAIKKDTSGAAKILDEIGDLLAGKKKTSSYTSSSGSLGVLTLDISTDLDDVWSGGGDNYVFGGTMGPNMAELEGTKLYNAANNQCLGLIKDACESNAVLQMARSSYNILITQDCNAYAKKLDSKKESVKQTVRTAEKYLREARLEEYHAHNSADVNECISRVKNALLADTACGSNYKRCLDYTGAYINQTTGEPIYSQRLFELTDVITLDGVNSGGVIDVLRQNQAFDKFLDSKRMYAVSALDSCRNIADTVWTEFKRTALIEIAQAQDEKIEEVKMSCVNTMAECYDRQTSGLRDFDTTTSQTSGALSAYAGRQMCADKVMACASLYGNTTGCSFDGNGKLISGNDSTGARCGLTALLSFVDTVDTTRISEGCDTALQNFAKELCTPTSGTKDYPWNCRTLSESQLRENLNTAKNTYCGVNDSSLNINSDALVNDLVSDIRQSIIEMMYDQCESVGGLWFDASERNRSPYSEYESRFYGVVYGTTQPKESDTKDYGICLKNTVQHACEAQDAATGGNGYAKYNAANGTCILSNEWYQNKCEQILNGTWENGSCYIIELDK